MDSMKISECVSAMKQFNLTAMVWHINDCPIAELRSTYIRGGYESHVVLASKEDESIPDYLLDSRHNPLLDEEERGPDPIILKFDEEYYIYIILAFDRVDINW
jgi:hypothetical protein